MMKRRLRGRIFGFYHRKMLISTQFNLGMQEAAQCKEAEIEIRKVLGDSYNDTKSNCLSLQIRGMLCSALRLSTWSHHLAMLNELDWGRHMGTGRVRQPMGIGRHRQVWELEKGPWAGQV